MTQPVSDLPNRELMPAHIGIIMDGNGRWAKRQGLPRSIGHKKGAETFEQTVRACQEFGIRYLTVYAFSTENWKRPKDEVGSIMDLLRDYLKRSEAYKNENVQMRFLGDRTPLDDDLRDMINRVEQESASNDGMTVNIALNYGGRDELVHAARVLACQIEEGTLSSADITEENLSAALYTAGQPDPDLIIRPSGEKRISNFLVWQSAYSEFVFMDVLWPDFSKEDLRKALWEYARRDRRFGGV